MALQSHLRYIVKFDHGYYEACSDQTCSCKGKQVINLGHSIILASKFCSFPGKIGKHQGHFSLIHWNLLSENQPRLRRSLLHPFLIIGHVVDYIDLLRGRGRSRHLRLALLLFAKGSIIQLKRGLPQVLNSTIFLLRNQVFYWLFS